jgi:hypothetical protein
VQPVGADDDVEPASRGTFECHLAVVVDRGDRVAEQVLDVVAPGVIVDLAEVVAHDLHVPVGGGAVDLGEVNLDGPRPAFAMHCQPVGFGGERLDARQDAHLFRDLHRRAEQVDGVAAGLAQRRSAFDDGDVEAVTAKPVREHRPGDAGAGDENPHDDLPALT